jgi:hypothetical protein
MGVSCQRHVPVALTPGMSRFPLYKSLDGPQDRFKRLWKISLPPGFDSRTVQFVASRYTVYAISAQGHSIIHVSHSASHRFLTAGALFLAFFNLCVVVRRTN